MGRCRRSRNGFPQKQVNPLKSRFAQCLSNLDSNWIQKLFVNIHNPIIVDVGCGEGEWCIAAAQLYENYNFLGIEIRMDALCFGTRNSCANVMNNCDEELQHPPSNVAFIHANILTGDLVTLLKQLTAHKCVIKCISIQFPDPYWKSKDRRKRLVQIQLLSDVAEYITEDGMMYIQSDIQDTIAYLLPDLPLLADKYRVISHYLTTFPKVIDATATSNVDIDADTSAAISTALNTACCLDTAISPQTMTKVDDNPFLLPCFVHIRSERYTYCERKSKNIYHMLCLRSGTVDAVTEVE